MKTIFFILSLPVLLGIQCQPEFANENQLLEQKSNQPTHIIFKASGNEPSWEVTINVDGGMKFISESEIGSIKAPNSKKIPIMDVAATSYVADTESANIRVDIFKDECINQLSHDTLGYRVEVFVKKSFDEEFSEFFGCGKYLPDYRLNDIWVLEKLNGKEIDRTLFKNERPYFEINIKDSRVLGFAGCNDFNGKFTFEGPDIIFSKNLAMTLMACPNLEFESEFVRSLTRSSLMYSIANNKLVLTRGDVELVFKKVD